MPITPFLKNEAFDQRESDAMSKALIDVCGALKIDGGYATAREVAATRIIELARRGERDPAKLRDRVLTEAKRRQRRLVEHHGEGP